MTDVLFSAATVVDGSGAPGYAADVLVSGGRIARIGPRAVGAASDRADAGVVDDAADRGGLRVIDARSRVLCPGFIDMHAHSDLAVVADTRHVAKLAQGVTSEVLGQDGIGYAPVDDATLAQIRRQIAGWNGNPADEIFTWRSIAGYLEHLDACVPTNVAVLVPQGNLRMLAVGFDDRPASSAEIDRMRATLAEGLDAGAVGMSSGLTYAPGMYADTAELESLCQIVAAYGGYYAPHTRSYGAGALDAYAEVIGIARRTGCALHLTHATLNFDENRGRAGEFLAMVDAARADGVDLTLDSYPYLPGATSLVALLPGWFVSGGPDATLARLADAGQREPLRVALEVTGSDGFHGVLAQWELIQVVGVADPDLDGYVGRTVREIARDEGREPIDVVIGILLADELATTILMHVGDEANLRAIMRHPAQMGGSDGILVGGRPHPRGWGTFPRYLGHYARDLGVLGLEECVRHLTSAAAERLRLPDRGYLREGYAADLVLFDPATVSDTATFDEPRRTPVGISHVMVNGELAIDDSRRTESVSGRLLRRRPTPTPTPTE